MSSQFKFNWSQFKFLNLILNCIKKKNCGTSSIQLNFLIHQLTVYCPQINIRQADIRLLTGPIGRWYMLAIWPQVYCKPPAKLLFYANKIFDTSLILCTYLRSFRWFRCRDEPWIKCVYLFFSRGRSRCERWPSATDPIFLSFSEMWL